MENKKQHKIKMSVQSWFIVICVGVIIAIIIFLNYFTMSGNYKRQAVGVLSKYKNGELTRQETTEKINIIVEKIEKDNVDKKRDSLSHLKTKIESVVYDLKEGEIGNAQIDTKIKEIRKIY